MARISFGGKSYDPRPPRMPRKPKITAAKPGDYGAGITAKSLTTGYKSDPVTGASVPKSPYTVPGPDESWKDETYFNTTAEIAKNLGNLKGYLVNAGDQTGSDYGIDFDRDAADPLKASNFRIDQNVDVTNPFSRAGLLKKSFQQAQAGNTNSMAARGQLYSGALQNAQDETGRQKLQADDSLIKDFSGKFGGMYQTWLQGQSDATTQGIKAQSEGTDRQAERPVVTASSQKLSMKQATAKGITFVSEGGKLIAKDSQGKPIPGARVVITGKTRHVIVPG